MTRKINTGIPKSNAVGLVMEGSRRNFIAANPFKHLADNIDSVVSGAEYVGARAFASAPFACLWSFRLHGELPFHIEFPIKCDSSRLEFNLSLFAVTTCAQPLVLTACITDGYEVKCDNLEVIKDPRRFAIPVQFATAPAILRVSIRGEPQTLQECAGAEVGFAMVTLEDGLFASSPIPTEGDCGWRGGERLSYPRQDNFVFGHSGTIILALTPDWSGPELGYETRLYFFDCTSSDLRNAICIYTCHIRDFG